VLTNITKTQTFGKYADEFPEKLKKYDVYSDIYKKLPKN